MSEFTRHFRLWKEDSRIPTCIHGDINKAARRIEDLETYLRYYKHSYDKQKIANERLCAAYHELYVEANSWLTPGQTDLARLQLLKQMYETALTPEDKKMSTQRESHQVKQLREFGKRLEKDGYPPAIVEHAADRMRDLEKLVVTQDKDNQQLSTLIKDILEKIQKHKGDIV